MSQKNYPIIIDSDIPFNNYWDTHLSNEAYHSLKTHFSSSGAKQIDDSLHSFLMSTIFGQSTLETPAMRLGTLLHLGALEPEKFKQRVILQPKFSGIGMRAAKVEWESSLDKMAVPVTRDEYNVVEGMLQSIGCHEEASELIERSIKECSGFYRDPSTNIACRVRTDFMNLELGMLGDIKTCQDHTIESFSRTIFKRKYHLQMAMYCYAVEVISRVKITRPVFLAVNTNSPYECALYDCDDALMAQGKRMYDNVIRNLRESLKTDLWPRYQSNSQTISLPKWAFFE